MTKWHVFDCTHANTPNHVIRGPEWLARLVAVVLSRWTGRFHDFDAAS